MTMKTNIRKLLTGIILLSGFILAQAQEQDEKLVREMTLEREYDPTIQDANKVNRLPELREPEISKRSIEYSPFTIPANPDKEIIVLPSGDIMTAIPYNNRRGYFHFGGGMYMNLNGDLGYHLLNNEKDKLNFYLSHRSTNGKVDFSEWGDVKQKAVLNDNIGGIDFKHYFDPSVFRLGANYTYSMFNYYGWQIGFYPSYLSYLPEPSTTVDRETNQVNQTINAYAGIQSNEYAYIGYLLDFDFVRFTQKYGLSKDWEGIGENKFTFKAGFNSRFGLGNQLAGFTGKLNYFTYTYPAYYGIESESLGYKDYIEATVTPYYRIEGDNWKAQLGVNLMMITVDSAKFFLSPNISIEAEIADKTAFYVNAGGEIQSNDAYGLSKRNRYMDYSYKTKPSRTWLDATLGIRSGVAPGVWFDVFAGYRITENEVFFVPSTNSAAPYYSVLSSYIPPSYSGFNSYYKVFQPDVSLFRAGASLKYMYRKAVDFSVKAVYNQWSLSAGDGMASGNYDDVKPYGRPVIEVNADLTVRPVQQLALTLGYYLGADRYTFLPDRIFYTIDDQEIKIDSQEIKMKDINDLNFTASWNFNQTFGAYLKLNNLLFQQQELWYGYPLQGFNAMVGINLNF